MELFANRNRNHNRNQQLLPGQVCRVFKGVVNITRASRGRRLAHNFFPACWGESGRNFDLYRNRYFASRHMRKEVFHAKRPLDFGKIPITREPWPGAHGSICFQSLARARDLAQDLEGFESRGMVENLRGHHELVRPVAGDKGVQTMPHRLR